MAATTETNRPTTAAECTALEVAELLICWFERAAAGLNDSLGRDLILRAKAEMLSAAIDANNNGQQFYFNAEIYEIMTAMTQITFLREDPDRQALVEIYDLVYRNVTLSNEVLNRLRTTLS